MNVNACFIFKLMKYRLYARVASVVRRTEISACKPSRDFKFFQNASLDPGGVPIFEMFCSPPLGAVWVEKDCFSKKISNYSLRGIKMHRNLHFDTLHDGSYPINNWINIL